ncbi:outer membrane beta-barrel family protein [Mucilaginibacter segetis]|uniref:TonB-dependent receptor n=1 Tax=Mucilaginibacter segetis TaxID=2793071 RepID=A0A934ULD3_9SPHI|nr:outer membrane beta-barrel family protein [Mucilaginibacter segetis]MBK0377737.1 TonB-dependent receptor [Mucilaginibacter segetis]
MRTKIQVLILTLISVFCLKVQAQDGKLSITGTVIDSLTKKPVDYATVGIYKQGSTSPFNGASTDAKGVFTIDNLPAGDYKLTVDFLGYNRHTLAHVKAGAQPLQIILSPVQRQLKTVNITSTVPLVQNKIDKMVYNAANDLTAQGGVAIDVLKKVPQVTVDIDGNVELQGNGNIRFLINGKPSSIFGASLADALQSIPASQIKSIEVVTSPGAKYDASGTGGIINIILKDNNVEGINGSVNLSAGTRRENGSFNLNARKGNFGVNAFFSGNAQLRRETPNSNNRSSTDSLGNTTTLFQNGASNFTRNGYQSGVNLEWNITPHDDLTGSLNFNHFGNDSKDLTTQEQTKYNPDDDIISYLSSLRNSSSKFNGTSTDWSLNYRKTFDKEGQELDVLYNSSYGKNQFNSFQQQDYDNVGVPSSGISNDNPGNDHETNISIDYTHPISKTFTIETGAKAVFESISNRIITDTLMGSTYVPNPDQTYGFNYDRKIYAYYLASTFSMFNDFLEGKAGLRDEYTTTSVDFQGTKIPSYNILAPSTILMHKLDQLQSIKLSFSYRIRRPDYGDLNPFYNISDPHNISTGNPNLKPEKGYNFELGYNKSFKQGTNINVAAFYRYNTDDLQRFTTFYPELIVNGNVYDNVSLTQRYNIGSQINYGLNLYGSVPVTRKLNLRSNMFIANRVIKNPGSSNVSGLNYRINLNASYDFGNDFAAETFINYRSSRKDIQGSSPAFYFYNIAVRKQFLNKKASIGLTASNPFNKYVNLTSTTNGANFSQTNYRQIPIRSFGITISYKFGKLDFSKKKEGEGEFNPEDSGSGSLPVPGSGGPK